MKTRYQISHDRGVRIAVGADQTNRRNRILNSGLLLAAVLMSFVLLTPVRSEAAVVVKARIGGVTLGYTDAPLRHVTSHSDACRRVLGSVTRRILASRPVSKHPCGCETCRERRDDSRLVWVPGHYEKIRVRQGRGNGHGHGPGKGHGKMRKVWIPGHWERI